MQRCIKSIYLLILQLKSTDMYRLFICFLALLCVVSANVCNVSAKSISIPDRLTEQTIRQLYIEHPDSCLKLLDEAELRKIDTDMPLFKIDMLRAMCHEIKGDYHKKEQCLRRLLKDDSVRLAADRLLKATVMLAGTLDRQNKYEEGISVCREAIDLARRYGKKKEEAEMLSTMARINAGMKHNDEAEKCFWQAVKLLEKTDDVREMANLSTIYGEFMTFLIDTGNSKEAIRIGRKREVIIDKISALQGPPPGYIDQQRGFLYAKMAVLLLDDGQASEASRIYDKYRSLDFSNTYTGRMFSVPYLLEAGRYTEALKNNGSCIRDYANDTISYDYLGLLENQARALRGLKDFHSADVYMQRCYTVQDSIYRRESEGKAQEYAALFDTQEKELQLSEAHAQSQRKTILIVSSITLIVLLLFILWAVFRNLRITRERNRIDAQRIDELLAQKEELRKAYSTRFLPSRPEDADLTPKESDDLSEEYLSFIRMENKIVENQLFLNPKINRDEILQVTGIGKNALVPLIKKYSGSSNLNDYINRLRLEYAVKMIQTNKVYTIDYIAKTSGFNSRSTFYRAFQDVYGMSPSQYLEIQHAHSEESGNPEPVS